MRSVVFFATLATSWIFLQSLAAQNTQIPSGPLPPAGTTSYETVRRQARFISYLSEEMNKYAVSVEQNRKIAELGPEILRNMPNEGGVLVIAWVATEKLKGGGEPRTRELRSVSVIGGGLTKEEALRRYQSEARLVADPSRANDQFYDLKTEQIWIPAQSVLNLKANSSVDAQLKEYEQKCQRLDADWKWIVAEHKFLEAERSSDPNSTKTAEDAVAETKERLVREERLLQAWTYAQQKLVAQLRESSAVRFADLTQDRQRLAATERDTMTLKRQLDTMVYNLCPNGCTYEQCTHEDRKKVYREELASMKSDYENRARAINDWKSRIAASEQQLAQVNSELTDRTSRFEAQKAQKTRFIERLEATLQKQRKEADADAEQGHASQTEFAARLRSYQQDRQQLQELEKKIKALAAGVPTGK